MIAFISLVTFLLFVYFAPEVFFPVVAEFRVALIIAFVSLILAFVKRGRPPSNSQTWCFGSLLVLALISIVTSPIPNFLIMDIGSTSGVMRSSFIVLTKSILFFFLMTMIIESKEEMVRIVYIILFFVFIMAFVSLLADQAGLIPLRGGHGSINYSRITNYLGGLGEDTNGFGALLVCMLPLPLFLLEGEKSIFKKIFYVFIAGTFLICIVKTKSRGAFVALLPTLLLLLWNFRKRIGVLLLIAVITSYAGITASYDYWERMSDLQSKHSIIETNTAYSRLKQLQYSAELMKLHPLTGVGIGNFRAGKMHSLRIGDDSGDALLVAHNSYFELGAEMGFPALVLFIFIIYISIRDFAIAQRIFRSNGNFTRLYKISKGLQIGFIGYLAGIFFLSSQYELIFYQWIAFAVILKNIAVKENISVADIPGHA